MPFVFVSDMWIDMCAKAGEHLPEENFKPTNLDLERVKNKQPEIKVVKNLFNGKLFVLSQCVAETLKAENRLQDLYKRVVSYGGRLTQDENSRGHFLLVEDGKDPDYENSRDHLDREKIHLRYIEACIADKQQYRSDGYIDFGPLPHPWEKVKAAKNGRVVTVAFAGTTNDPRSVRGYQSLLKGQGMIEFVNPNKANSPIPDYVVYIKAENNVVSMQSSKTLTKYFGKPAEKTPLLVNDFWIVDMCSCPCGFEVQSDHKLTMVP